MEHFGVYARIRAGTHVLLVHKTRGPYTGLLDLPGGQPEPGESWAETLQRELHEELGAQFPVTGPFTPFTFHVAHTSAGTPIDFHHHGVFTDVPAPTATTPVRSPDTNGTEWFDLHTDDHHRLSTLVRHVLSK
ncbi:NUDIX domain-containing protein [Kribbella sp. NPDC059898]|uniref:NUDIX domain-containing protein n=1 Tax=Kribbella sp. NPDC059898 TaxID=3346995 RepID=UPI0036473CA6